MTGKGELMSMMNENLPWENSKKNQFPVLTKGCRCYGGGQAPAGIEEVSTDKGCANAVSAIWVR